MSSDASERLADAERLLDSGEPEAAAAILEPLTTTTQPVVATRAWMLLGTARYRVDDEQGALAAWQRAAEGDGPDAWLGWRSVAEQRVRDGELEEAIAAYRQAQRRAPPGERGAIANRIGWLLKETGHDFAARRQFNRARGTYATYAPVVTWSLIASAVAIFLIDVVLTNGASLNPSMSGRGMGPMLGGLMLFGPFVEEGQWWRVLTVALVHLGPIHLAMNMYVLYVYGPVLEQMYGHAEYLVIYGLCAAGGSALTFLLDPGQAGAGASGAIFGLIGLLFVATRRHRVMLNRDARAVVTGLGSYIVFLLIFTFVVPGISWTGHLGGMLVGAAIGFLIPPGQAATLGSLWRTPGGEALHRPMPVLARATAYALIGALLAGGSWFALNFPLLG
ncbi:MAG TPA: rhomboid family intramembrane serine protease [Candidatus Limnocylindria bacterium]|nr:rhomboid family intramembrane serine protease [Candidatus Limnocylindria bacterium]